MRYPTNVLIFDVGFRPSIQPTPRFIKTHEHQGFWFLYGESNQKALIERTEDSFFF